MSKENWKSTGKELGKAFEGLAKTMIRSAKTGLDKAEEWAERDDNAPRENPQTAERNVFNDGSWRETGRDLGHAMKGLGKTILTAGTQAVDKAEEWAESQAAPQEAAEPQGGSEAAQQAADFAGSSEAARQAADFAGSSEAAQQAAESAENSEEQQ